MDTGLTPQEKSFCRIYAAAGNASEAARIAGYPEKIAKKAWKWLKIPKFNNYINDCRFYKESLKSFIEIALENKDYKTGERLLREWKESCETGAGVKPESTPKQLKKKAADPAGSEKKNEDSGEDKKSVFERIEEYKKTLSEKEAIYKVTIEENPFLQHIKPTKKQKEFLLSDKREILYGGAAGGGKSAAMLMAALMFAEVPNYKALLLRRTYSQLNLPCALMDMAHSWLDGTEAKWCAQYKQWEFPSGATLNFGYLDSDRDKYRYQGAAFHFIGFDELTQFTEQQYIYLFSRSRKSKTTHTPLRFRAASNPGGIGHEWVKKRFFDEKTGDRQFISARAADNPYLDKEEYEKNLNELDPVTRKQLRDGDWEVQQGGNFFRREKFGIAEDFPQNARAVRYWDMAASEKMGADFTAGVKMCTYDGQYWIIDVTREKSSPAGIEKLIRQTAELDGSGVEIFMEQEPGSSGINTISHYSRNILTGFAFKGIRSTGSKITRARPFAAAVENNNVRLVRGAWNRAFIDECVIFPQAGYHDDMVDAAGGVFEQLNASYGIARITTARINRASRVCEGY